MKPINITPHRLKDQIVTDAIVSINRIKTEGNIKGRIAGGMAVQSYIPETLHRETIDLDFSLLWHGSRGEFKELCNPLKRYLESQGYELFYEKKRYSYDIKFRHPSKNDSFMLQHPNFSTAHFKKLKKSLEREISNQRIISSEGFNFGALSPEDLVVGKLHRILKFSNNYHIWTPKKVSIKDLRHKSKKIKESILPRLPEVSPSEIGNLRLINDCYDIKCLSENVGLNKNYFDEIAKDWGKSQVSDSFYGLLDKLEIPLE